MSVSRSLPAAASSNAALMQELQSRRKEVHTQFRAELAEIRNTRTESRQGQEVDQPPPVKQAPGNPFHQLSGSIYVGGTKIPEPAQPRSNGERGASWAPYEGPRSEADGIPEGGGKLLASGAPEIKPNPSPVKNQYGYAGPAAQNPYFTSPGNPLRPGYVRGFENWFEENWVVGGKGPIQTPLNKTNCATEEGAQEALRLVQQQLPGAKIVKSTWGSEGGPYTAIKPTWEIELPGGARINAGGILNTYYNQGYGVTIASDTYLQQHVWNG